MPAYRTIRSNIPAKDIDQSRLASTVRADDGNTGSKGDLEGDVADLRLGGTRVLECHLVDANNRFGLGLYAFKETGFRELELDFGSAELVVGSGGRNLLNKL